MRVGDDGVGPVLNSSGHDSAKAPEFRFIKLNDVVVAICFPNVAINCVLAEVARKHER